MRFFQIYRRLECWSQPRRVHTGNYNYNNAENPVQVHDIQARRLHMLGLDHTRLTFKYQGRQFRLTNVWPTGNA